MTDNTPTPTPEKPSQHEAQHTPPSQTKRRITYGVNVLVAVVVALAVTGLINYIAYNYLFPYRMDLTATGEYSLSPQTRKAIQATSDPIKIVSLFSGAMTDEAQTRIDKAKGLVDEYGYISSNVTVEHIDPVRETSRLDAFYQTLKDRYAQRLAPLDTAVEKGMQGMRDLQAQMKDQEAFVRQLLANPDMPQGDLPVLLEQMASVMMQQREGFASTMSRIEKSLQRPLADYSGAITLISSDLQRIDTRFYGPAITQLQPLSNNTRLPDAIRNELLKLIDQLNHTRRTIRPVLDQLAAVQPLPEYEQLYQQLASSNVVVLIGEDQVQVVTLDQMFKLAADVQSAQGTAPELQFLGEEKITGALIGMQQKQMPMVVFVSSPQMPALGQRGMFQSIGQRLENMRFRVEEWTPQGRPGPMGQMLPAGPPPKADPGQKAVWIVLPLPPPNPMAPMQTGGAERVISLVNERAAVNDGVMIMLAFDQGSAVGVPNPLALWTQEWGITARTDRMILRERLLADRRTVPEGILQVTQWPDELVITQALAGFDAVFAAAMPLELSSSAATTQDERASDVKTYPLAIVQGQGLWAEREPKTDSTLDPATAADSFIVAAAATRGDSRMVVVADPVWATDQVTTNPRVPGNAELFVNSVYWLSGLEQMIAASARTQDIRRVQAITPATMLTLRWVMMLGMPLVVGCVGVGVWWVRRRG